MLVSQVAVSCCGRLPLWFCCVVNTLLITGLEFVTGCVVNGIWMECLELHKPAAQPDGTGLYRLHRAVVFAERSGDRACLPGAPPPAGEKGDRIGALLSGVALGVAAAAAEGLSGAAAGKALIQRLGPRGGENLCKRLGVDVAPAGYCRPSRGSRAPLSRRPARRTGRVGRSRTPRRKRSACSMSGQANFSAVSRYIRSASFTLARCSSAAAGSKGNEKNCRT